MSNAAILAALLEKQRREREENERAEKRKREEKAVIRPYGYTAILNDDGSVHHFERLGH